MAWLAVDSHNQEGVYSEKPHRGKYGWWYDRHYIALPHGSIQKLIGRSLTWEDEPVELKGE